MPAPEIVSFPAPPKAWKTAASLLSTIALASVTEAPAAGPDVAAVEDAGGLDEKVAKMLDSLSDEEQQALLREMSRRQMRKWQERAKSQHPDDGNIPSGDSYGF
jgi:hypothetical protein